MLYLINEESKSAARDKEQEFKNQIFANNLELYRKMFAEDQVLDEDDIDYIVPEDESTFNQMLRELKSYGLVED